VDQRSDVEVERRRRSRRGSVAPPVIAPAVEHADRLRARPGKTNAKGFIMKLVIEQRRPLCEAAADAFEHHRVAPDLAAAHRVVEGERDRRR
jgi:hypothetical protein